MRSTFSRHVSATILILVMALLLLGGAFRILVGQYLEHNTHDQLRTDALALAELVAAYDAAGDLEHENLRTNLTLTSLVSGADTVVLDARGNVILCSDADLQCRHLSLAINQEFVDQVFADGSYLDSGSIPELYEESRYFVAVPIRRHLSGSHIGVVVVSMPMDSTTKLMEGVADIQVTVSLLVILVAVVVLSISTRSECRPLREMAQAARDFGHGNLKARVRTGGHNSEEVDELAVAFNNMAESLEKSEYQRQEFVANVSHELKTPLAVISNYATMLQSPELTEAERMEYANAIHHASRNLADLVTNILKLNKLENQQIFPETEEFDLAAQLCECLLNFEDIWEKKDIQLDVDMPETVVIKADPELLALVWNNLLSNAMKFTPEGGAVRVSLTREEELAVITVSDTGCGMTAEQGKHIFEKFYQTDPSHATRGNGLGLALVKRVVDITGSSITVQSTPGKGSTFTVRLGGVL